MRESKKQPEAIWYGGEIPNFQNHTTKYFAVSRIQDKLLALSMCFDQDTGLAELRKMITIPLIRYSSNVEVEEKHTILDETISYHINDKNSPDNGIRKIMKHEEIRLIKFAHALL